MSFRLIFILGISKKGIQYIYIIDEHMFSNKRPPVLKQVLQAGTSLFQSRQAIVLKQADVCFTEAGTCFKTGGHLL